MFVVVSDPAGGWVAQTPTWGDRVRCRVAGGRLDRALAAGVPPESDPVMSLRALYDTSPRTRRQVAGTLRRILRDATHPQPVPTRGTPALQRARVRRFEPELQALIGRLEGPGPVSAAGTAQILVLLADAGGPLYASGSARTLGEVADEALRALDGPLL